MSTKFIWKDLRICKPQSFTTVDRGSFVDHQDKNGATALFIATCKGNLSVVRLLLDRGADVNLSTSGVTPLGVAALKGHLSVVQLFVDYGADVDDGGHAPIMLAVQEVQEKIVEFLLGKDAKTNVTSMSGLTPLHLAAANNHVGF